MGHLSLSSMRLLFPSFFFSFPDSVSKFNCDICQLSKHVRNSYFLSNNKSYVPFALVHFEPSLTISFFWLLLLLLMTIPDALGFTSLKQKGKLLLYFKTFIK